MLSRSAIRASKLIQHSTESTLFAYISTKHIHSISTISTLYPCTSYRNQPTSSSSSSIYTFNHRSFCEAAAESEPSNTSTVELSNEAILDRIKKVLGEMERAKIDESKPLTLDSHIYNDVGLDSLDFVEFGIALEDEFGIEIEDDKAEGIVTVGDAVKLIRENPKAQ